jgi:hypothetical protein
MRGEGTEGANRRQQRQERRVGGVAVDSVEPGADVTEEGGQGVVTQMHTCVKMKWESSNVTLDVFSHFGCTRNINVPLTGTRTLILLVVCAWCNGVPCEASFEGA